MNAVMLYTRFRPVNEKGGTEHTTAVLAKELRERFGMEAIATYRNDFSGTCDGFDAVYKLPNGGKAAVEAAVDIVRKHHVETIVVQGFFRETRIFYAVKKKTGCRLFFAYHFQPGWESLDKSVILKKAASRHGLGKLRYRLKYLLFPLFSLLNTIKFRKRYYHAFRRADKVVVLSRPYERLFLKMALAHDEVKICSIPNMLPYHEEVSNHIDAHRKEKVALIVSRLDERQKRVRLALELWKRAVGGDPSLNDWRLYVVGDGDVSVVGQYREWAEEHGVPRVTFTGRANPMPYYQKASVFIMTSLFEGLPLTILESRQCKVVPVAFDTFGAIADLIHDGKDGFVVKEGDEDRYVSCLRWLMNDDDLRSKMMEEGLRSLAPFRHDRVAEQWHHILEANPK